MSILFIAGSPTVASRSARLLDFIAEHVRGRGYDINRLNVRDLPAQALLHADFSDDAIHAAQKKVAEASAVVIATPVYKSSEKMRKINRLGVIHFRNYQRTQHSNTLILL